MPSLTSADVATLTDFFNYVDTNGSGKITVDEIRDACAVDTDGDGTISEQEIVASAQPWMDAFLAQDLDGDQAISLQELLDYNAAQQ